MRTKKDNTPSVNEAWSEIVNNKLIPQEVFQEALKESIVKAYRKHINCPDAEVRVELHPDGKMDVYQQRKVIDTEVEDDEIEISLEDAQAINPELKVGDILEEAVSIADFGRATVSLAKNVMLQKIKEASKQIVFDEYSDKIDDITWGTVQTVEDKYTLIQLDKTLAMMPKSEQIPGERLTDGQRIRVLIKSVAKETKGAQVIVSRASANLVKRLFEITITEIYDGTVEVKAIAREAGERTKMAVYSKNPNVDAVGSCIGHQGQRVKDVLEEITKYSNSDERIDVVEWSPNIVEFVKNIMKPAEILGVLPSGDSGNLLLVVENEKLSQAIGKRGINARLASKLMNRKIDIKSVAEVQEMGIDWVSEAQAFAAKEEALRKQRAIEEMKAAAEKKAAEEAAKAAEQLEQAEEEPVIEETVTAEPTVVEEPVVEETVVAEPVAEEVREAEETVEEVPAEEPVQEQETVKKRKPKLEKASEYVSKYEELADARKSQQQTTSSRRRKTTKEDEEAAELRRKLEELRNQEYQIKPEYTEEELEDFNNDDEEHWYDEDIDYDDYDDYYDDEE
ncbi:MAG: transcription termination/antitermination protein NusA [Erysipelotrichaceae bacterium]|nr:transcription termination/antitermination protein NusA [Erysipelotrichaceae bacterium]MBR2700746.1 transcription termination/antitermination protein NusA [Erysipelotrichaceae bacterium]MBR2745466.1 transcription termination/antitermination protein NusA [Erysipelotrichaceae bacterium]